jgi:glycosyltransferase involved in cell wall biosynthesis
LARALIIAYTTYIHDARVRRHAEALAARGHQVDVISISAGEPPQLAGVNLIGIVTPRYRGGSRSRYLLAYAGFFARAALVAMRRSLKQSYDVAIACSIPDAAVLAALPCRLFGTRIVLDVHDTMPEMYRDKFGGWRGDVGERLLRFEERASAALANHVLAVHEPHAERLVQAGIKPAKITVVTNGPDPSIFSHRNSGAGNAAEFLLACHGTMSQRSGLDIALDAFARLRPCLPNLRLLVIGGGDYYRRYQDLSHQLGLDAFVTFRDLVPTDQIPSALNDVAVGLVPYRETYATRLMLPAKLLEYAALGIPAVAPRLPAIQYYFDENTVRYFEPGDVGSLAAAIEELYREPARREQLAASAARAVAKIGWPVQSNNFYRAIDAQIARQEV